jgi:hypothetical protein
VLISLFHLKVWLSLLNRSQHHRFFTKKRFLFCNINPTIRYARIHKKPVLKCGISCRTSCSRRKTENNPNGSAGLKIIGSRKSEFFTTNFRRPYKFLKHSVGYYMKRSIYVTAITFIGLNFSGTISEPILLGISKRVVFQTAFIINYVSMSGVLWLIESVGCFV